MEIYDLKINGIREPLGFTLENPRVSWKVRNTASKHAVQTILTVAADPQFSKILLIKQAGELNPLAEELDLELHPRTRYFVRVEVTGDSGDAARLDSWFETGKMAEPFAASWIGTQPEDRFHPVFFKNFSLSAAPCAARLYITGLGLYEASLNGKKVGDEILAPFCNDYN